MADLLQPPGYLANLRALDPKLLEPLLAEEAALMEKSFHWRVSRVGSETRGIAWVLDSQVQGYLTLALNGSAAIAGTLFVSRLGPIEAVEWALLQAAIEGAFAMTRVEHFSGEFLLISKGTMEALLAVWPDQVRIRHLMAVHWNASGRSSEHGSVEGVEPWRQDLLRAAAQLLVRAYAEAEGSDFGSVDEDRRALEDLTVHPGHCFFEPKASFAAVEPSTGALLGFVLACWMGSGVGHIAQLVVAPEHRRKGLGRGLLTQALDSLLALGCHTTHLAVNQDNNSGIALYRNLGFQDVHAFPELHLRRVEAGPT